MRVHESHRTRLSDSSLYDEVCTLCGATDRGRNLEEPCAGSEEALARQRYFRETDVTRLHNRIEELEAEVHRLEHELDELEAEHALCPKGCGDL